MTARVSEFARFALVGFGSTILYLGLYAFLVTAGAPYVLASIAAFLLSAGAGYFLHHRFTFRTRGGSARSALGWLTLQGSLLVLNLLLLLLLVGGGGVDRLVAQIVILPIIPALSYVLSRQLVFLNR